MKLYTEEQVREAIAMGYDWCNQKHIPSDDMINTFIEQLTPIELPSDEEIIDVADDYSDTDFKNPLDFLEGAQWMRDKILNK